MTKKINVRQQKTNVALDYVKNQVIKDELTMLIDGTTIEERLSRFQSINGLTSKRFLIKERKIDSTMVQYVPIRYMERILNVIFDFQWDAIRTGYGIDEYMSETRRGDKPVVDAWVSYKFTYPYKGKQITKEVFGSRKMFKNKASSKFGVLKAAQSQAIKNFGQLMGIGSDLNQDFEEDRFSPVDIIDMDEIASDFTSDKPQTPGQ